MTMLHIFNSLTRQKEIFKPMKPNHIGLYVCGITVYDYCHIGHARMFITFDMVTRYLRSQGYQVNYVRNITDIDDKIIKRAEEQGIEWHELTEKFIQAMYEDEKALHVLHPDIEPKATDHIPEMVAHIQLLIDKGFAYVASNGDVYFHVEKFKEYGKLSHQDIEGLRSGARIEISEAKQDPLDFVLWKLAKPNKPFWPSPWGNGRPGWHIECSAMSSKYLGKTFDIHGGGFDLQFPHHENEIAQSECAYGCTFVNLWMHNGFVQINEEKMSKSLNNFFTVREVLQKYHPEAIRYFMVASHYRSPVNYSEESLQNANAALQRFYQTLRDLNLNASIQELKDSSYEKAFVEAMNDDFNTPIALSVLFDLATEINKLKLVDLSSAQTHGALLVRLAHILGILFEEPILFLQGDQDEAFAKKIDALIQDRENARKSKNWARADEIRKELKDLNIILEDGASETVWRRG